MAATDVTAENYQEKIASVLGVSTARAAEVAAEYPLADYSSPTQALSVLAGDASFVAGTLQVNTWLAGRVPTYTYEFNDDAAPLRYPPPLNPPVATHGSELTYVFDLPDAVFQAPLSAEQEALADSDARPHGPASRQRATRRPRRCPGRLPAPACR